MFTKEQIKVKIIQLILNEYFDVLGSANVEDITFSKTKEEAKIWFEALFDLVNQYSPYNY